MKTISEIKDYFRKHSVYTIGSNLTNILSYANSILIGRILGPSGLSDIGTFAAYLGIFSIPISILGTFVTQISSLESHAISIFNTLRAKLSYFVFGLLLISILSLLFASPIKDLTKLSWTGGVLLMPNLWLSMLIAPLAALTLGGEKYKANVVASFLGTFIKILAVPIIIISHWYISDISIIAITLGQATMALLLWVYLDRHFPKKQSPTLVRIVEFAKNHHLAYTILGSASMILLVNLDIVVARQLFDIRSSGIYATWSLLSKVVFFTLGPLLTVSFVKQSQKANTGENALDSSVNMLILFCIASLVPLFIGYQYIAPTFLKIVFGSKFEALYQYLGLSGTFGAFTLLLNHLTNTHIARRSWYTVWTIACVGVFAAISIILKPNLSQYYVLINATVIVASLGLYLGLQRSVKRGSSVPKLK